MCYVSHSERRRETCGAGYPRGTQLLITTISPLITPLSVETGNAAITAVAHNFMTAGLRMLAATSPQDDGNASQN
jgi:hypothetical protein